MRLNFIMILMILFIVNIAHASEECISPDAGFWNNAQGRGWFWKQKVCVPVKDNNTEERQETAIQDNEPNLDNQTQYVTDKDGRQWKKLPDKQNIPWDIIDFVDPIEVSEKIEPQARSIAIMYPTKENITEYRELKNWMLAKASGAMVNDIRVRTENPSLVKVNSPATSSYSSRYYRIFKNNAIDDVISTYRDRIMIVMFSMEGCQYCELQRPLIRSLSENYGINFQEKDIDREYILAGNLGVTQTPDIFLLFKSPSGIKYQRIATGLTTVDKLKDAIVRGLSYLGENIQREALYD